MIQAIVFDCFGVLVSESWNSFKLEHFRNDQEKFDEAGRIMDISNEGKISYAQFTTMIAELAGMSSAEVDQELKQNRPNLELFELIGELKKTYKIAMLSNVASNFLSDLFTPQQLEVFDVFALSCDLGLIKPDPEIYKKTAAMLGVSPEACIFTDDTDYYVIGAEQVGMQAIHYTDFASFKQRLGAILDVSNSDK